ncbi:hypothetical protein, partial [Salmonella enterica]|uniref:hypothetical protein n=1 Tax=Salmonella enterica TaxID=28901 RepID=UPI00398C7CA0
AEITRQAIMGGHINPVKVMNFGLKSQQDQNRQLERKVTNALNTTTHAAGNRRKEKHKFYARNG